MTIACTTEASYIKKGHYTIIDAPGRRDFIGSMITCRDPRGRRALGAALLTALVVCDTLAMHLPRDGARATQLALQPPLLDERPKGAATLHRRALALAEWRRWHCEEGPGNLDAVLWGPVDVSRINSLLNRFSRHL